MLVEHAQVASAFFEVIHLLDCWFRSIVRSEFDLKFSWLGDDIILTSILISESVSSNNDRLSPAWDESWDIFYYDGFSENGTIEDVPNSSIWRSPHLLKFEFFNSTSIRSNCGTFDCNFMLLCCICCINCDLIICFVTRGHTQIIVFRFYINVRVDVLNADIC